MNDKSYRAVVLAGGTGTRLRPLTDHIPKPLAPIGDEVAAAVVLSMLERSGVNEALFTLMYKGEMIEKALGKKKSGVELSYMYESTPLGTAGCIKNARDFICGHGDFIVASGDAVCDFDLSGAIGYHKAKGAIATLVLTEVDNPGEYGSVIADLDLTGGGEIKSFIEKPPASQAYSDLVNTGIYILSEKILDIIEDGKKLDFARDIFPSLIGRGLYGYKAHGYWCDIGSIDAYKRCLYDAAAKKIGTADKVVLSENRNIVGRDCRIADGAIVSDSVLHLSVSICESSEIRDSVICDNTLIEENVSIRNSVIGAGSMIGAGSVVENARLAAGSIVVPGSRIISEGERPLPLSRGCVRGLDKNDIPFLAAALLPHTEERPIGVMWQGERPPQADAILNILGKGSAVLGRGYRDLAVFAARNTDLAFVVYIDTDEDIYLIDSNGTPISHETERRIISDFKKIEPEKSATEAQDLEEKIRSRYFDALFALLPDPLSLYNTAVSISANAYASPASHALRRMGTVIRENKCDGYHIEFSDKADLVSVTEYVSGNSFSLGASHIAALLLLEYVNPEEEIFLPCRAPKILDVIIKSVGAHPIRYAENTASDEKRHYDIKLWLYDSFAAALMLISYLKTSGSTLEKESRKLPEFVFCKTELEAKGNIAPRIMRDIMHGDASTEGARIDTEEGSILYLPQNERNATLYCDAVSEDEAMGMIEEFEEKYHLQEK